MKKWSAIWQTEQRRQSQLTWNNSDLKLTEFVESRNLQIFLSFGLFGRHVWGRFVFWWVGSDLRARLFLFRNIRDGHLLQFDPSSTSGWLASITVNGGWQQQFQTFSQVHKSFLRRQILAWERWLVTKLNNVNRILGFYAMLKCLCN